MLYLLVIVLLIGALLGFIFSKKGREGEGAIDGAKKAGGCFLGIIGIIILIIIVVIIIGALYG